MSNTPSPPRKAEPGAGPAIILVGPQMGENIGATARVMANFGLGDLRLVAPRDGWPNPAAQSLAAGALEGYVAARVYDETGPAVADLGLLFAATARPRGFERRVALPREAAAELRAGLARGVGAGVLFGAEASGLPNADVARADAILTFPAAEGFSSLNLAQAVGVLAYEWAASASDAPPARFADALAPPASKAELEGLLRQFEDELDATGHFWPDHKAEQMKLNLRAALARAGFTAQDVRTLRGAIKALVHGPRRRLLARKDEK